MFFNRLCKITFIAHGATIYSEEGRVTDIENYPPLNDAGENEIERICQFLKKRGVKNDKIYTSIGTRTTESAEIIAKIYKTTIEPVADLSPRKYGTWNNLTMEQIFKRKQEEFAQFLTNPKLPPCENSESLNAFSIRIGKAINKIVKNNQGNRIIIVTYPEVIQAAIVSALKLNAEKMINFHIKTGSATQISYYKDFNSLKYAGYVPLY